MNRLLCLLGHTPRRMSNGWRNFGSGICCERCQIMLARNRFWLTVDSPDSDVYRLIPHSLAKGKVKSRTYGPEKN